MEVGKRWRLARGGGWQEVEVSYSLKINNIKMLEKIVSGGGRILDIIELTTEYDILIISSTALRARIEIIMEGLDSNLAIILEDRVSSSKLSNVLKDFESMTVNDNNIKEL